MIIKYASAATAAIIIIVMAIIMLGDRPNGFEILDAAWSGIKTLNDPKLEKLFFEPVL
jgi:hypothetical protein